MDRGPASAELASRFPTRRLYQFVQRSEPGDALLRPSYIVEPLRVVTAPTVRLHFATKNPGHWRVVSVAVVVDGHALATQTLSRNSRRGATASFDVVIGAPTAELPSPATGTLVARVAHDGQVAVDVAFGPHDRGDRRADVYSRRYFVAAHPDTLAVQLPGLQYHRFDFGKTLWIRENVDATLTERR